MRPGRTTAVGSGVEDGRGVAGTAGTASDGEGVGAAVVGTTQDTANKPHITSARIRIMEILGSAVVAT